MFSKKFRNRNKPKQSSFLDSGELDQQFIPPVQTKLNIGKPGDKYEQEADQKADQVVANPNNSGSIQAMEEEEAVQMQEEDEAVQMQEEEEAVQMKKDSSSTGKGNFEHQLHANQSNGQKLDSRTKREMELGFGADFSSVNIHKNSNANKLNKQLGARAFTHGKDIYFRNGEYDPSSSKGKHLLAHELTHTIQQGAVDVTKPAGSFVKNSSPNVQAENIRYRQINWANFEADAPEGSQHDAAVSSGIYLTLGENRASMSWSSSGNEVTVTVTYNSDAVGTHAIMSTHESWKNTWLTDDDAAREKLGDDADIANARSSLLSHEQIHFTNAHTVAQRYDPLVKAAVPNTSYSETFTASSREEAQARAQSIFNSKAEELDAALEAVRDTAAAELSQVQEIYDHDTNHSQNEEHQANWQDNYDQAFTEARTRQLQESENGDHE